MVSDANAAVGADLADDGLWAPEKREVPRKSDEEPWGVPDAIKGEVPPRKPTELAKEGGTGGRTFPSFGFVLLVVALGAVFAVWKKTKKHRRRES